MKALVFKILMEEHPLNTESQLIFFKCHPPPISSSGAYSRDWELENVHLNNSALDLKYIIRAIISCASHLIQPVRPPTLPLHSLVQCLPEIFLVHFTSIVFSPLSQSLLPFPSFTYRRRLSTTHRASSDCAQRARDRRGSKRELEPVTVTGKYDGGTDAVR